MTALAILGVLLALWLASACQQEADEDYAKGMDEYRIKMREIHGLPGRTTASDHSAEPAETMTGAEAPSVPRRRPDNAK